MPSHLLPSHTTPADFRLPTGAAAHRQERQQDEDLAGDVGRDVRLARDLRAQTLKDGRVVQLLVERHLLQSRLKTPGDVVRIRGVNQSTKISDLRKRPSPIWTLVG